MLLSCGQLTLSSASVLSGALKMHAAWGQAETPSGGEGLRGHQLKDALSHMRTTIEAARKGASPTATPPEGLPADALLKDVIFWLDEAKAEEIVTISLEGKSSLGDYMVIASGRTDRHVGAIAEQLRQKLKDAGCPTVRVEGLEACDWVLIDSGDIIVHVFRPEVREFYNLEKMWSQERPGEIPH